MTTEERNTIAANRLIERAMNTDKMGIADMLIHAAHKLDSTIDIDECLALVNNNWMERQYKERIQS